MPAMTAPIIAALEILYVGGELELLEGSEVLDGVEDVDVLVDDFGCRPGRRGIIISS